MGETLQGVRLCPHPKHGALVPCKGGKQKPEGRGEAAFCVCRIFATLARPKCPMLGSWGTRTPEGKRWPELRSADAARRQAMRGKQM